MNIIADLQLHSRFSRAVSPQMTIPNIAAWAARKGIGLVATGDWTHPMWFREIQQYLEEMGNGLLKIKDDALAGSSFDSSRQGPDQFGIHHDLSAKAVTGLEKTHRPASLPFFLLATEVSCIYSQGGKGRRVHTLIWVPTIDAASKISKEMTKRGCNLLSDGRPIIGLTSIQVAELVLSIEPKALIIGAHIWTPWFSVYGKMGGFDSIEEAFGPYAKYIYAVETGLSSNPSMNWRIKELDNRAILSFSDAHSGPKIGREATVFEIHEGKLSYEAIYQAIRGGGSGETFFGDAQRSQTMNTGLPPSSFNEVPPLEKKNSWGSVLGRDFSAPQNAHPRRPLGFSLESPISNLEPRISYTIEFYPEEGKYHYTGHRACHVRLQPGETKIKGSTCSVCGKPLTQGVMERVEELAGRSEADLQISNIQYPISNGKTIQMTASKTFPDRPPFVMLVPLQEIISEAIGSPVASPKVQGPYVQLTNALGGEFCVLLEQSLENIVKTAIESVGSQKGERIAEGLDKVRRGDIVIDPGYDGVFGVVKIWGEGTVIDKSKEQLSIF